jgi:ABC exporter DevB family membrane fusion protein
MKDIFGRLPAKQLLFALVMLALLGVVVKRSLAPPPTIPTSADIRKAERDLKPKAGTDERAVVPAGQFVAGNGLVEPADRETKVSSHIPGRIAVINVKEGDFVEAGAELLSLDNGAEKSAVDAAEGDVASARAELTRTVRGLRREDIDAIVADTTSIKARTTQSKTSLERIEQLAKGGAATPDELDRARQQAEVDQGALAAAEARKKAAVSGSRSEDILVAQAKVQASLARRDQAQATYERTRVRAPITGRILQLKFRAGEFFNPNGSDPLVVMGDTRSLRVRMDVDERDVGRIRGGQAAFALLSAFPGKRFAGRVVEVGRRMGRKNIRTDDPTERIDTKILEVVIALDPAEGLVPGLRVTSFVEVGAEGTPTK